MDTSLVTLMLQRAAQAIEQVIIPELTEGFALEEASHIASMLRSLAPNVEEKSQDLREENKAMRKVLERVLRVLHRRKALSQNAISNGLIEILDHELKKVDDSPPDVSQENHNLKRALVETIKALDALAGDLPIKTASFLRQQIRFVLRQQLDHAAARRLTVWSFLESQPETPE